VKGERKTPRRFCGEMYNTELTIGGIALSPRVSSFPLCSITHLASKRSPLCGLSRRSIAGDPRYAVRMVTVLYRCPGTGFRVQGYTAEEIPADHERYEPVTCLACKGSASCESENWRGPHHPRRPPPSPPPASRLTQRTRAAGSGVQVAGSNCLIAV